MKKHVKRLNKLIGKSNDITNVFGNMVTDLQKNNEQLHELHTMCNDKSNRSLALADNAKEQIKKNQQVIDRIQKIIE